MNKKLSKVNFEFCTNGHWFVCDVVCNKVKNQFEGVIYLKSSQGLILLSTAKVADKVRQNAIDCVNQVLSEFESVFNLKEKL